MVGALDGDPVDARHADGAAAPALTACVPRQPLPPDAGPPTPMMLPADTEVPGETGGADQRGATDATPRRPPARRRRAGRPGMIVRAVGELLITAGLLVGLFLVYQLWITDIVQARTQARLRSRLAAAWTAPARPAPGRAASPPPAVRPHPSLGQGFAVLHVPRFGADYAPVIVEGAGEAQLQEGPGHYPGTAMPGEIGNFVISGHRTTYGKPFNELDELRPVDPIVVEVSDRFYVYRLMRSEVVQPTALDVTDPVPERPGRPPSSAVMTMTTCNPKYSAATRLIVFASLEKTVMKAPGVGVPFEPAGG
jgi:sortase A